MTSEHLQLLKPSLQLHFTVIAPDVWRESVDSLVDMSAKLERKINEDEMFRKLAMVCNFSREEILQVEAAQWGGGFPHLAFIYQLREENWKNKDVMKGLKDARLNEAEKYLLQIDPRLERTIAELNEKEVHDLATHLRGEISCRYCK